MTLQCFSQSSKLARFVLTGLLAIQGAIATIVVHEFIATTPDSGFTQQANAQANDKDLTEVYKKARQAVVLIETPEGSGSGAIIASNGLIVTNAHVVEGASRVRVTLHNGRRVVGEVVAAGNWNCVDLALVRIPKQPNLPIIELAPSDSTEIGLNVFAIGNPLGTRDTLTDGKVSNLDPRWQVYTNVRLSQGNSGGPLLNYKGQLVGVIKGGYGADRGDGLNIAVAAEQVQALMQSAKYELSPLLGRFLIPAPQGSNTLASKLLLNGAKSNGTLQKSDNVMCGDRSRADLYTFKGGADQPVMISMSSAQIGSYLLLLGPNGKKVSEGRSEERGGTAKILARLSEAGTYTLIANALRPEQLGAYELQATVPLLAEQGHFNDNSPQLRNGSPYSSYRFTGKANQTISIALDQFNFEPYLILRNADSKVVAEGKVHQSAISIKLPQDGSYTLTVSTANPSDRGRFSFSVHSLSTAQPGQVSQKR